MEEIPQGYNIGWDIIGDRCVTTGAVPSSFPYGNYYLKYESIIWKWDGNQRKEIIHMVAHCNGNEAEKVHRYIVGNLKSKIN